MGTFDAVLKRIVTFSTQHSRKNLCFILHGSKLINLSPASFYFQTCK